MNKMGRFSIMGLLAVLTAGFAQNAVAQNERVLAEAQRITGDRFTISVTTPNGANVYAVNRPSAKVLNAIDQGLTDLFAIARKNRYSRRLNYSDYNIYIGRSDRTKDSAGSYSPDIAIGAAQYAGSYTIRVDLSTRPEW